MGGESLSAERGVKGLFGGGKSTARSGSEFAKNQRFRNFVRGVKDWTDGRRKALRTSVKQVLAGGHGGKDDHQARELILGVRTAPDNAPRLWRRENASDIAARCGTSQELLFGHLKARVGDEVEQDLVSTSASSSFWHGDFISEIEPGARAIHAYPLSHHPSEQEWITAGRFRLLAVDQLPGLGVKVRVEQTAVF